MTMLQAVTAILERRGTEGWLVGGSVRDRLLGRFSPDLDVAVLDDAAVFAGQVAAALHAPCFALSERHPTYRVLGAEGHLDVASVRGAGIAADLSQRDFTINAMALPLTRGALRWSTREAGTTDLIEALLDPFGGASHLRERRLVAVSEKVFVDDPLRLLRAARFCHVLGFALDAPLRASIEAQAGSVTLAAAERVMSELSLTLASGRSAEAARLWHELGLLQALLPEIGTGGAADAGGMASTLAMLTCLDETLERPRDYFPEQADFLRELWEIPVDGAVGRPASLRLASLLSPLGPDEVRRVGHRLKLSGALLSLLTAVSARRRFEGLLPPGATVSREVVLFLWEASPWEPEVILVEHAEERAGAATPECRKEGDFGPAQRLMALAVERARGERGPCPVDGEVLMRQLGLQSGPTLGRALREAHLAWEAAEATSVGELLAVARAVVS